MVLKENVVAMLHGYEIKKKSIRCQRNQQLKVPNFPTHTCICCIRFFFILKTIKKKKPMVNSAPDVLP